MWQMVFANILVEGWIVYPNVYSFFDQPDIVVLLSPHYGEIINSGIMTCDGSVVMYGGGVFKCSLNLSPKVLADSLLFTHPHTPTTISG